ncbi:thioredoxin-like protein [Neocallimastix lanati (nom. inval.)]|jgi:thioredoxin-like negative regulator of GroEL|uniref:Thioredoxin-like protein n=1 Tax=Neocallimastix californiae TaxID=1754190 RepID=A0A1Y2FMI7_9FUNG|nr:thioredoxin-like protein [Neocallimastix sp. JGI-2020a]ORY85202.1 thioredoxin-like protein [Neocallimastix californiae]|eukprot:ORY85202.1 thioredoxin-like protein [Neocallimastix californiae]
MIKSEMENEATDVYKDEDDIFAELEAEDDEFESQFREQRMKQLKQEMDNLNEMKLNRHGTYEEIKSEKEVLNITTKEKKVVAHFFHKDFRRCQILDGHLEQLAKKHFKTKFIKVDVENAPFLVTRLGIRVLPCVISFVDGITVDRIIGFEELGNTDDFSTEFLETRLSKSDVLVVSQEQASNSRKPIFGFANNDSDSDSDYDY